MNIDINSIANIPDWQFAIIEDIRNKKIKRITVDKFPFIGDLWITDAGEVCSPWVLVLPELSLLRISVQFVSSDSGTSSSSLYDYGRPIRLFMGTEYTGIIAQYCHDRLAWCACFTHGNFGNKFTDGGTWSAAIGGDEWGSLRDVLHMRRDASASHIWMKAKHGKREVYRVSEEFWVEVFADLRKLEEVM